MSYIARTVQSTFHFLDNNLKGFQPKRDMDYCAHMAMMKDVTSFTFTCDDAGIKFGTVTFTRTDHTISLSINITGKTPGIAINDRTLRRRVAANGGDPRFTDAHWQRFQIIKSRMEASHG